MIKQRRSIRKFKNKKIQLNKMQQIAEAALYAPSSRNKAPWEIFIISEKEKIEEIAEIHKNWAILKNSVNNLILVCSNMEQEERENHAVITCSAATQNILLKATELKLGSLWLGLYPDEVRIQGIRQALELSDNILPISLLVIGESDIDTIPKKIDLNKIKVIGD